VIGVDLSDRVALVTGGGTGIGAAVTSALVRAGAAVVIAQSTAERAKDAAAQFAADGLDVGWVAGDLADATTCADAVRNVIATHGRVDILVNNAAVTGPPAVGDFLTFDDEQLDRIVDVNLKAAFRCGREAARDMAQRASGVIVHISSVGAFAAQEGATAYVASKAALTGLTKGMAFELAPHGIRVVGVAPGDIDVGRMDDDDAGPFARRTPLGRRGAPADIGDVVAFLCSDSAGFITGETVVVDGGWLTY
jgi:NAD(P)-dependent dehydrogenase (short-subunit alcohol dehydrogenase family)